MTNDLFSRISKLLTSGDEEFSDPVAFRRRAHEVYSQKVIRALHLPNGETFKGRRVIHRAGAPPVISESEETFTTTVVLPIVLAVLRHGLGAPAQRDVHAAARAALDLITRDAGVQWTRATLRIELEQPGITIGFQEFYRLERSRLGREVKIVHMGGRGPATRLRADTRKLVHLICEQGVLCTYRRCNRRGEEPCPQRDLGCTREASDETVAALSLLVAPIARYSKAIKKGQNTVTKLLEAETEAVKKVRSRKGISRAAKVKHKA